MRFMIASCTNLSRAALVASMYRRCRSKKYFYEYIELHFLVTCKVPLENKISKTVIFFISFAVSAARRSTTITSGLIATFRQTVFIQIHLTTGWRHERCSQVISLNLFIRNTFNLRLKSLRDTRSNLCLSSITGDSSRSRSVHIPLTRLWSISVTC